MPKRGMTGAFALDCVLLACSLLLLAPRLTGLPAHEWLGICLVVPVALHLLLASGWVMTTLGKWGASSLRTRVNFCLNAALLTLVVLELVSGVVVSRVALPRLGFTILEDRSWRALHNYPLNWLVLVLGIHLAMNWRWIMAAVQSQRGSFTISRPTTHLFRFCIGVLIVSAMISALTWALLGSPSAQREYRHDEVARFSPSATHGLIQLAGEAGLVAVVAFIARRWLRVRL